MSGDDWTVWAYIALGICWGIVEIYAGIMRNTEDYPYDDDHM